MGNENLTGTTLGQYELRDLLGSGGMGTVYSAWHVHLKVNRAIKIVPFNLSSTPGYLERFNREAEIAASLEHPHILSVIDFGIESGLSYVVMRRLDGGTLSQRMRQREQDGEPLPSLGEVSQLLNQMAGALDHAHTQGVIHRDVKASNIMFDNQGSAYLLDFGIAKLADVTSSLTGTGMAMGTPSHMAPEQWRNDDVSAATDQYALGIVIYTLVAGRVPFEAPTPYQLMSKHLNDQPTPPHQIRTDVPEALAVVLNRALAKRPQDRFPTVTAFAQAFAAAITGAEGKSTGFFTFKVRPQTARVKAKTPSKQQIPASGSRPVSGSQSVKPRTRPDSSRLLLYGIVGLIAVLVVILAIVLASGAANSAAEPTSAIVLLPPFTPTEPTATPEASPTPAETDTPTPDMVAAAETLAVQLTAEAFIAQVTGTARALEQAAAAAALSPATPTDTETATHTATFTDTATLTDTATHTTTATETATDLPTATHTATYTPTATETPTDLPTATDTATATRTATDPPTATDTATYTPTATETPTDFPTATDTVTYTPTATHTATLTLIPALTPTNRMRPSPIPTDTSEPTLTSTPTLTASPTPSSTSDLTLTAQVTQTASSALATRHTAQTSTNAIALTPFPTFTPTSRPSQTPVPALPETGDESRSCLVSTTSRYVPVRTGPGLERLALLHLPTNREFVALWQTQADDGSLWWRIDERGFDQSIPALTLWVNTNDVNAIGDCDSIKSTENISIRNGRYQTTTTLVWSNNCPPSSYGVGSVFPGDIYFYLTYLQQVSYRGFTLENVTGNSYYFKGTTLQTAQQTYDLEVRLTVTSPTSFTAYETWRRRETGYPNCNQQYRVEGVVRAIATRTPRPTQPASTPMNVIRTATPTATATVTRMPTLTATNTVVATVDAARRQTTTAVAAAEMERRARESLLTLITEANADTLNLYRSVDKVVGVNIVNAVRVRKEPGTSGGEATVLRTAQFGEQFAIRPQVDWVFANSYTWIPIVVEDVDAWVAHEGFIEVLKETVDVPIAPENLDAILTQPLPIRAAQVVWAQNAIRAIDEAGEIVATWYWDNDGDSGGWGIEMHLTSTQRANAIVRVENGRTPYLNISSYENPAYSQISMDNAVLTDIIVEYREGNYIGYFDFLFQLSGTVKTIRFASIYSYSDGGYIDFRDPSAFPAVGSSRRDIALIFPTALFDGKYCQLLQEILPYATLEWAEFCSDYVTRVAKNKQVVSTTFERVLYRPDDFIDLSGDALLHQFFR